MEFAIIETKDPKTKQLLVSDVPVKWLGNICNNNAVVYFPPQSIYAKARKNPGRYNPEQRKWLDQRCLILNRNLCK